MEQNKSEICGLDACFLCGKESPFILAHNEENRGALSNETLRSKDLCIDCSMQEDRRKYPNKYVYRDALYAWRKKHAEDIQTLCELKSHVKPGWCDCFKNFFDFMDTIVKRLKDIKIVEDERSSL